MSFLRKLYDLFMAVLRRLNMVFLRLMLGGLGKKSVIYPGSNIAYPSQIFIGDGVSIASGVHLGASSQGSIHIGDRCAIAAGVRFVTPTHDYNVLPVSRVGINKAIVIGKDVWIGTGAIILPGVTVQDGAVVAAGAVVSKDVAADCVVGGVPARVIKKLEPRELRLKRGEVI